MPRICGGGRGSTGVLEVRPLELPEVLEIRPHRFTDERGFFSEVWSAESFASAGIEIRWVQDNQSFSKARGVLRGLHFQLPPAAQDKLVRVARGSIYDVAVDLRRGSPTFAQWVGTVLSARQWNQLLIPRGFAHGFVTLEDDCDVLYKTSAPYRADLDRAIRFDDPDIAIDWPVAADALTLSDKDRAAPLLSELRESLE